jgi:hypothetical protein
MGRGMVCHAPKFPALGLLRRVVFVDLDELFPLVRHFIFHEDGVYRALGFAEAAVNALAGVNIELIVGFVNTIHGADGDA